MRSCLGIFFFVFIVFPMLLGALVLFALNTWIFDKAFYIDTLDNPSLYAAALEDLPDYFDTEAYQRDFADLTQREQANTALARAYAEVITPGYLRGEIMDVVDDVFQVFDNPNDSAEISVNMLPVKTILRGEKGADFARVLVENLPDCAEAQEPRDPDDILISCRSQTLDVDDAIDAVQRALPAYIETLPNKLTLNDGIEGDTVPLSSLSLRAGYRSAMIIIGLFSLLIWLLVAFIFGRGMRGNLLWLGGMLLIPAAIVLCLGVALNVFSEEIRAEMNTNSLQINEVVASEQLQKAVEDSLAPAFDRVGNGFGLVGGIAVGLSVVLLFFGGISPRPHFDTHYVDVPQRPGKNNPFY